MNTCTLTGLVSLGFCITVGSIGCGARAESTHGVGGNTQRAPASGGTEASGGAGSDSLQTGGTRASSSISGATSTGVPSGGTSSTNGGATSTSIHSGGVSGTGGAASSTSDSSAGSGGMTSGTGGSSTVSGGSQNAGGQQATATGGDLGTGGTDHKTSTAQAGSSTAPITDCSIAVKEASYSSRIGTVGIVSWSTTLANVDKAQIEFGVDTTYGLTAPVDLDQTDYRTVLLGMKPSHSPYHFRITAWSRNRECMGADEVFAAKTSPRPSSIKGPRTITQNASALSDGFLVSEGFRLNNNLGGDYAFILDKDGDFVWWYQPSSFNSSLSVAKMTYDGKAMWLASDNILPEGTAHVGRVSMDGETFEDMSSEFAGFHHDLAVLPDETVVFIAYGEGDCDEIKKLTPDGQVTRIVNVCEAFGNASSSHCNAIRYDASDDTVIFSDETHSAFVKTDLQGNIRWVLNGGPYNDFDRAGAGASGWTGNHGFHITGNDRILFFNNGVTRDTPAGHDIGITATARELLLDTTSWTTTEVWSYNAGIASPFLGDVQRLENGNTLVVFSLAGTVHELDANKNLVQSMEWSGLSSAGLGYATKRKTLYGPPPR